MERLEIVTLSQSIIPQALGLITGYLNSGPKGTDGYASRPDDQARGEQILQRLLSYHSACCYVAKLDEEYVGLIVVSWSFSLSKGYPVLRVDGLYSSPAYRNMGVAEGLIRHVMKLASDVKAARLQLETDDINVPARSLYEKLGFQLIEGKGVYMLFL